MNKIRCFFLFVFGGLLSATVMEAQEVDFEKEFDDFQKQQQKEFNDFKNKADADFETFLRETWVKFEAFDPLKAPVRPEPEKQPVFDGKRPQAPVEIKPVDIGKPSLSAITDKPVPGIYVPVCENRCSGGACYRASDTPYSCQLLWLCF